MLRVESLLCFGCGRQYYSSVGMAGMTAHQEWQMFIPLLKCVLVYMGSVL